MWSIEHVLTQKINFETASWKLIFWVRNCPNANLNSGDNWSELSTWIKLLARFSPGGHLCAILSKLSFSPLLPLTALHQGLNAAYTSWVPTSSSSPSKYQVAFWSKKEDHLKSLSLAFIKLFVLISVQAIYSSSSMRLESLILNWMTEECCWWIRCLRPTPQKKQQ